MLFPGGSLNPQRHFGWTGAVTELGGPGNTDDPSTPDPLYWTMAARWAPIRACMEGTQYLRLNAETYLPRQPMELEDSWRGRVSRSVFSPFLQKVIRTATGLILRKPVFLEGGDEAYWESWRLDVDRAGTDLDSFCRSVLTNALAYGHQSWLVDFPDTSNIRTLREQVDAQLKPYFVQTNIWDVLGWRQDPREDAGKLQQVRIREVASVPKGRFGQEYKNRVRVLEPGKWELFEAPGELGTTGWELIDSGRISVSEVPLVTVYGSKLGTLFSDPPFEEIAQLNLCHFARHADLIQSLHVAAQPILILRGWDDSADPIGLSANTALVMPPDGGAEYVSTDGGAFDAQRAELDMLVEQMSSLGIAIMSKQKNQAESGLAKALDRTDSNAILSVVSKDLEKALQQAINLAAEYAGVEPCEVIIDRDFNVDPLSGNEITAINTIYTSGMIDQRTALEMLKRGEVLGDDLDLDDIIEMTEEDSMRDLEEQVDVLREQSQPVIEEDAVEPDGEG